MIASLTRLADAKIARFEGLHLILSPLLLRIVMAWEYFEAGWAKLHGDNWFGHVQDKFPFPFNSVPSELSWFLATWIELLAALALLLGLGTRLAAFALLALTFVATAAVHWPDMWTMWGDLLKGYAISDSGHGNFKLPLLFSLMLVPLLLGGGGRLSLDALLRLCLRNPQPQPLTDGYTLALGLAVFGIPFCFLLPTFGLLLLLAAGIAAGTTRWLQG